MLLAQRIGNLVLEDGKHPGLEYCPAVEAASVLEGADQGFLDRVLGQIRVGELQAGELEHVASQVCEKNRVLGPGRRGFRQFGWLRHVGERLVVSCCGSLRVIISNKSQPVFEMTRA